MMPGKEPPTVRPARCPGAPELSLEALLPYRFRPLSFDTGNLIPLRRRESKYCRSDRNSDHLHRPGKKIASAKNEDPDRQSRDAPGSAGRPRKTLLAFRRETRHNRGSENQAVN